MTNLKLYIALVVIVMCMMCPVKAMSPDELEKGKQLGVAPCVVRQEKLLCILIEYKKETYSIAGYVKDGDFYARYVAKQIKGNFVIVWSYGGSL